MEVERAACSFISLGTSWQHSFRIGFKENMMNEGIVVKARNSIYEVKHKDELIRCVLRPKIKLEDERMREETKEMRMADLVSVGDQVIFSSEDGKAGYIEEILPRANQFGRTRIGKLP
ncbi:hypothetical protein FJZ31_43000, partial [Candidatus Poribacteria bacterium]|nr:hypothetical protein [Candidatus Poribacteria bacterium]